MPEEARGKAGKPTEKRNKPVRPRDDLGRPQPWGAENTLQLEDYDSLPREENHRLAREHLAAGRLKYRESVIEGLDNAPQGLIALLKGQNFGKQLVKLA